MAFDGGITAVSVLIASGTVGYVAAQDSAISNDSPVTVGICVAVAGLVFWAGKKLTNIERDNQSQKEAIEHLRMKLNGLECVRTRHLKDCALEPRESN